MTTPNIIYTSDKKLITPGIVRISELSNEILFPGNECNKAYIAKLYTDLGIPIIPVKSPLQTYDSQRGYMYQIWLAASRDPSLLTGPNAEGYEDWNSYFKHPVELEWQKKLHRDAKAWDPNHVLFSYQFEGRTTYKRGCIDFNIGYPVEPNVVEFDLDTKNGVDGPGEFCKLMGIPSLDVLDCYMTETTSGGIHIPMLCDDVYGNSAGQVAPGIDIRSLDGFVMLPGSSVPVPNGFKHYKIKQSGPVMRLPDCLKERLDALKAKPRKIMRVSGSGNADDAIRTLLQDETYSMPIRRGQRHDRCKEAFFVLRGMIEDDNQLEAAMTKYAQHMEVDSRGKKDLRDLMDYVIGKEYTGPVKIDMEKLDWCVMENVDDIRREQLQANQVEHLFANGDDDECARFVVSQYTQDTLVYDLKSLWTYDDGVFMLKTETDARNMIRDHLRGKRVVGATKPIALNDAKVRGVQNTVFDSLTKSDGFFEKFVPGVAFKDKFVTVTQNGFEVLSHTPKHRARVLINSNFNEDIAFPKISEYLRGFFNNKTHERAYMEWFGATLMGRATKYKKTTWLKGPTNCGKSVLMNLTAKAFHNSAVSSSAPNDWDPASNRGRWSIHTMVNAMLNVCDELPKTTLALDDVFKMVISGGLIQAEEKGKTPYKTQLMAGQVAGVNELPDRNVTYSEAALERISILPVSKQWKISVKVDDDGEVDTAELFRANVNLVDELSEEIPGFVVYALKSYYDLMNRGGYEILDASDLIKAEWIMSSNPVAKFLHQNITITNTGKGFATKKDLYARFVAWSQERGHTKIKTLDEIEKYILTNHARDLVRSDRSRHGVGWYGMVLNSAEAVKPEDVKTVDYNPSHTV